MKKEKNKIVILGGGYAGLQTALELFLKGFKPTLIDKNSYHDLLPELPHIITDRKLQTTVPFSELLPTKNINFIQDEVTKVNYQNNTVELKSGKSEKFDYLVLALGSQVNFFGIPGLAENSLTFHSTAKVNKFIKHIEGCFKRAKTLDKNSEEYTSLLTFVIGGGGLTGVEVIGELIYELPKLASEYGINSQDIQLHLVEAAKSLLMILDKDISDKVTNFYKDRKDVDLILETPIKEACEDKVVLANGQEIKTNTILWTGGVRASDFVDKPFIDANGNEGKYTVGRGFRLEVDKYYKVKDVPNTYAIGDIAMILDPQTNTPMPQNGQAAYKQGKNAAYYISADINNESKEIKDIVLDGLMVSLGPKKATGMIINPRTFYLPIGFIPRLMKKIIELRYKLFDIRR